MTVAMLSGWIVLHDRHHLRQLLAHEPKGNVLIGDKARDETPGVLLGKEALRDDDDQPDIERDRSKQGQQHDEAMVERKRQRAAISIVRPLKQGAARRPALCALQE